MAKFYTCNLAHMFCQKGRLISLIIGKLKIVLRELNIIHTEKKIIEIWNGSQSKQLKIHINQIKIYHNKIIYIFYQQHFWINFIIQQFNLLKNRFIQSRTQQK
ncbi:unnamed protein product [Paramecium octaurelia]|uniref:Uncharacterized protein n=1 Tax=Paramecium octaurelia TaxID=43137 RepID=A0A8S1VY10_PAROT|nr:unnamed protein product [Paramecium octaurelia]